MKLFTHTSAKKIHTSIHREFDVRRYWVFLLVFFVLLLTVELFFFSWQFLRITKRLDAPATPVLESNAARINSMKNKIDIVQSALMKRTGKAGQNSSQNNP